MRLQRKYAKAASNESNVSILHSEQNIHRVSLALAIWRSEPPTEEDLGQLRRFAQRSRVSYKSDTPRPTIDAD